MRRTLTPLTLAVATLALVATTGTAPATASANPPASSPGTPTLDPLVTSLAAAATASRLETTFPDEKPRLKDTYTWEDGTTYARYERTWKGLPVVGGRYAVALGGGKRAVEPASDGTIGHAPVKATSTTPRLSAAAATGRARTSAARELGDGGRLTDSKARVVVYVARDGVGHLAYDVLTNALDPEHGESRLHTYVDATTGAILGKTDEIQGGTESGNGAHSGRVSFTTTVTSGGVTLKDGYGNTTRNALHKNSYGSQLGYAGVPIYRSENGDDIWGSGTYYSGDRQAVDAQFGIEQTWAYWVSAHGRRGQANDGVGTGARVHAARAAADGTVDPCMSQASWNTAWISFGDGAGCSKPFTQLDIVAHEFGHGVTWYTSGFEYELESGGLNEAMSDIFGTMVEIYASKKGVVPADPWDYNIGEKIDFYGNGTPLRYMDKPSKDQRSLDCWEPRIAQRNQYGNEMVNVHYSSGPMNHAFYLLAEGSGVKTVNGVTYSSPTCNGTTMGGIGPDAAAKIVYGALTSPRSTPTATYLQFRDEMVRAAIARYGSGSPQCVAAEKAMSAINVAPSATSPRCTLTPARNPVLFPRDVTGDKVADVLLTRTSDGAVAELRGTGIRTFTGPSVTGPALAGAPRVAQTGTWDDAGAGDLVATDTSGRLWVYNQRRETGTFRRADMIGTTGWTYPTLVSPGDMTGDARADLFGISAAGDLIFYARTADGKLARGVKVGWAWGQYTKVVPVGDITLDGRPDLVAVDRLGQLWLYRGNRTATYLDARVRIGGAGWSGFTSIAGVGDITGDGRPDILVIDGNGRLRVYPGAAGGYVSAPTVVTTGLSGYRLVP